MKRSEINKIMKDDVDIYMDGRYFTVKTGDTVRLKPGESISIQTGMYPSFWAEGGKP